MIKSFAQEEIFPELCRTTKKWGLHIAFDRDDEKKEFLKAAPYLNTPGPTSWPTAYWKIIQDGWGVFLFDTHEEMETYFWQTVGKDGPTRLNKYDGPCRVYALTCSPEGELQNENA